MSKSIYEFWLSYNNGKEKLRLPVLPESLNISSPSQNESVSIAKLGEATIIQDPAAKIISFSSFFPATMSPLVEYAKIPKPWDCVKKIEKWKASGKPIRLIVTKTPINWDVSIEDFSNDEVGGAVGDINYEISLKEFKFVKVRKINTKKKKATSTRPNNKAKVKTYKVLKGDTLWTVARRSDVYGNSAEWKKLWNANKEMLIKRDKRNIKQPGHWIYPNQVLKVP
ncbi:LysM peptidoglycan-binding domain-containing protein [Heyndrickxia sp. NPDC080065]|uniref:LysM peptidoglycan-binding domain-containing protein n=1 Tax=Heyndrickxia sp. NPDC080065 TaxID=3390568 RepID=UPI003CFC2000